MEENRLILEDFGYTRELELFRKNHNLEMFSVGRVIAQHKERYIIKSENSEYEAEIIGRLRFTAVRPDDFPAVGDWVAFSEFDENKALIHSVFSRKSILSRKTTGKQIESQIIAANIDCALIVTAVDSNFNINRIERYLAICNASNIESIIILNKIDLITSEELERNIIKIKNRLKHAGILCLSNKTNSGYDEFFSMLDKGKTYCLLGSSGVGKSSILNHLSKKEQMKTSEISSLYNKGKHTTTHRELFILDNGAILIDNPGMREVGIADVGDGLERTFDSIEELSRSCKFTDCQHINEKGCAVLDAIANNEISGESLKNYRKMLKEKYHFESSVAEKRKSDRKFGKMIKSVLKEKNKKR
ncbi:MAG: ribosome small subunit-dependent GTPase A [Spirochaetia bacterium]|nr:ribosome small subunit-dependent GTPase A [Spirochaetia bacterium]